MYRYMVHKNIYYLKLYRDTILFLYSYIRLWE